ncbi:MAG: LacI family DNA-binding transcriptional regulator [bacterium]|nr:LacI family DNA-binding transcriptional regulator [bacterium]
MPSIKEVAQIANVSPATVSLVLNGKGNISPDTRQRVLDVVQKLGYTRNVRARNLRDQQSRVIGYARANTRPEYNPILEQFTYYLVREIEKQNRHVLLFTSPDDSDTLPYADLIDGQHVDGFVLSYTVKNDARFKFLSDAGVPFVAFGRSLSPMDEEVHWVDVDGRAGMYDATNHLIQHGHERIAMIAWDEESASGQERVEGYLMALHQHGITPRPELINRKLNGVDNGYLGASELMRLPNPPTAVICVSDMLAAGVLRWSALNGIKLGVIGFDDHPIAQFMNPPLTTLRQPVERVAIKLAKLLSHQLDGNDDGELCELIPPELVVRESSL